MHLESKFLGSLVLAMCVCAVSACGGGGGADANGSASVARSQDSGDSVDQNNQPIANPGATDAGNSSSAPRISGEAVPAVTVGEVYVFQPEVTDPNGERLTMSVENLPSWAFFDEATGRLSGTPQAGDVGTYRNIVIRASNGRAMASLPAFDIEVEQMGAGSALVSWAAPEHNTDGTPLTDLVGFHVHFGRSPASMTHLLRIDEASASNALVANLSTGKWYFAVSAINSKGMQSNLSAVRFKLIP